MSSGFNLHYINDKWYYAFLHVFIYHVCLHFHKECIQIFYVFYHVICFLLLNWELFPILYQLCIFQIFSLRNVMFLNFSVFQRADIFSVNFYLNIQALLAYLRNLCLHKFIEIPFSSFFCIVGIVGFTFICMFDWYMVCNFSSAICWKDHHYSAEFPWNICVTQLNTYMWIHFWTLFFFF